ncbi:MAG TPA: glycosyltransferase family 2 protein [Methyloversatilis sp.]
MTSIVSTGDRAPVALFVYNRPDHTRQTLAALQANTLAAETPLYIFVDAPRDEAVRADHAAVLECVRDVQGFASVTLIRREQNLGLAGSIIDGAGMLCERHGRVIVLEDDLITSPHFLRYMNDALDRYVDDEAVGCISAYMYPVKVPADMQDTLLLPFPMSWGWATWARAWKLFDADGSRLVAQLGSRGLTERFDRVGPGNFMRMLNDQIAGRNNSWFIRWHASLFLAGKLSLAPVRSTICNIGLDGTGVHCSSWRFDPYQVQPSPVPLSVGDVPRQPIPAFDRALRGFFIKSKILRYVNALDRLVSRTLIRVGIRTGEPNGKR